MTHPLIAVARERLAELAEDGLANEDLSVSFATLSALAEELGLALAAVVALAKAAGLDVGPRPVAKASRGFTANSHDRWSGPGSCATHGGSGWEQISGFAGQKG